MCVHRGHIWKSWRRAVLEMGEIPGACMLLRNTESLSLRLECSGAISAYCNLYFPSSSDSCASASQVTEITGVHHHAWLIFVFLVEMGFCHVDKAGLELLASSDLSASVS
uniref:Uncharacterized protein n=1 Tax=Papio anubis TaxID=9555 RepID=A0A8I5P0H8_PAPAN